MPIDSLLASGIEALKHNDRAQARTIFMQAVRENPHSEQAWLLLGRCLDDPGQQMDCYRRALVINPSNERARQELARLSGQAVPPAPARPQERPALEAVRPQQMPVPPAVFAAPAGDEGGEAPGQEPGARLAQPPAPGTSRLNRLALAGGMVLGFVLCLAPLVFLTRLFMPGWPAAVQSTQPALAQAAIDIPAPSRTPRPSATAAPTRTPGPAPTYAGPDISQINKMINQGQDAQAIAYLDQLLAAEPENDLAWYGRAAAYLHLSGNNRTQAEYEDYLQRALGDIDQAIRYSERPQGSYYYYRYQIYEGLHNILERRADRQRLDEVMLENLIQADALIVTGLLPETTQRNLSMQYFAMHRCEEGLAVLQYVIDGHGPYAPPSAALLYYQGGGAYCQGELEKAIDYLNRAIAIEALPNAVQLRAEALYMLGRYDEARQDLDGLIEAKPYYNGGRYYQRAAVQYALGDRQAAEADLHTGDANTWGRYGWRPYVTALMARDDGDAETAVQDFQEALDTLSWYEYPLFDDIQAELEKLGAQPLPEEASVTLRTTPLPTPQPTATRWAEAVDRLATQAAGGIVPPDSGRLAIERGLTSITYQNTNQARAMLTYYFAPSKETVAIDTVSRLVFHLEPEGAQPDKYELFLWDFHTGEWFMFRPGWGEIDLEDPGRFVTPEGEVYFLIRPDVGYTITFERLWAEIDATQTDGSPLHLGVAP